jgi:hypothetical protein
VSLDQFELLELHRDDGIQTFHAREISTARPVQVHFLESAPEALALLSRIHQLPDADRRRVLERGVSHGRPYVITDRLAGFASLREWLESKTVPSRVDQQLFELFESNVAEPKDAAEPKVDTDPVERTGVPLVGFLLGIAVAIGFLVLLIAAFVFRPR